MEADRCESRNESDASQSHAQQILARKKSEFALGKHSPQVPRRFQKSRRQWKDEKGIANRKWPMNVVYDIKSSGGGTEGIFSAVPNITKQEDE